MTLSKQSVEQISDDTKRVSFTMEGSIQSSLIIGPKKGVKLINWSLLEDVTPPTIFNDQKAHFVLITHGLPGEPWNITMDFQQHDATHSGPLADIIVVTTFWEYHRMHTKAFDELINKFPSWAHVIPSVAAMNIHVV